MIRTHYGQHDGDCFGCKLVSVNLSGPPSSQTLMERRWMRDMPAYQRLRRNGLQPKQIDGSADLECRASNQLEVEMGLLMDKKLLPSVAEGMAIAREMEWSPLDSVEDLKNKYHRPGTS